MTLRVMAVSLDGERDIEHQGKPTNTSKSTQNRLLRRIETHTAIHRTDTVTLMDVTEAVESRGSTHLLESSTK